MKRRNHFITLALLATALAATSCRNPLLSVGLGDKVDILPPGISIVPTDGVQNGAYVQGTVTVYGDVSDDVGVETVTWMFADEATGDPSPVGTATLAPDGSSWSFVLDTQNPAWGASLTADGEKSFVITVTDGSGKATETRMLLIFDNTPPSGTFINPANGASVYSTILLRGANSDNTSLIKVEVRIGKTTSADADTGFVAVTGSKYDWSRSFLTNDYANTNFATDNGDGTWELPIYLRVYDYAGNVSTNEPSNPADPLYPDDLAATYGAALSFDPLKIPSYHLVVDLDRDKPEASIQTPLDSANMAGTVIASGTCFDESPGMKWVQLRIMALEDDDTEIGYVRPDGTAIAAPGWINLTPTSGAYWSANLNEDENLYDVIAAGGAYEGDPYVHNGRLRLEVQPVDDNDKVGNIQAVTFRLDQSIPRLENPEITLDDGATWNLAHDYLYVSGTIRLRARVSDDVSVAQIKLSLDGGSTYGDDLIGTCTTPDGPHAYWLDVEIDTLTDTQIPLSIRGAGKSGLLGMAVKVWDDADPAPYINTWLVTLNLDNAPPTAAYTAGATAMDIHGDIGNVNAQLAGTATDAGTVGGIDRVEVYLVNVAADQVIDLETGGLVAKDPSPQGSWDYTANLACKKVITWDSDWATEAMELQQSGSDVAWRTQLDTDANDLPDGAVEIHYVAWDNAGNLVHGELPGFIRNNVPSISSVTVGTDLDGNTTVDADEKTAYNPLDPITARNDALFIKINTSTVGMNTPFTYSIKNTTPGEVTELSDASGEATIDISGGRFGGDGTGRVFTVKITDAVGIEVQQTVTVDIDNVDGELPTITVDPIAAPDDLLDWNDDPVAGHIEAIGISTYDNGGTPDADVSGTVMVRGSAHDNVRIDAITLSIDGDPTPDTVAHWNGSTLVSDVPALFQITSQGLTDAGHDVAWDYKWNTAGIATVAKDDVVLAFVATDKSTNDSANAERTRQYDVVPYVTGLTTTITGLISSDFARAASGDYPVRAGETITVSGYNLAPSATGIGAGASDVRVVSTAERDNVAKTGRGLVYAGVGSPYTSFTANVSTLAADASIKSGYLVVWVAGVPSLNARSGRSNAEDNFVATSGTDERFLSIWARTVFKTDVPAAPYANHASYPSMRMNGNTPVFAYVNNVEGYGRAQLWTGAAEWEIYENWDLFTYTAIDLNSSGNHAALYDINVVQNGGINWPSDKGGILTSFWYQPPDTTWNGTSYYYRDYNIWLDNLFKNGVSAILGRYQYPDIDVSRDGTTAFSRIFYSVYDAIDDRVLVRAFDVGTNSGSVGSTNKVTDTATNLYTDIAQQNQGGTWPAYTDVATNNRRFDGAGNNAGISPPNAYTIDAAGAGPWTAVAGTSGNVAVVAWYDTDTNKLKFAYNASADVAGAGTFTGVQELDTFCGGDFVDIAVDAADHIHIAYHDSFTGDLMYVYLNDYDDAFEGPYVVDSYLTVGNKATISVSTTGVPYLSYKGMGNTAKVAWLVGTRGDGADGSGKFNGTWEVQVLPTRIVDNDTNRFWVGVDSSTLPVVGYTNDGIEYVRRLADLP